MAKLNVVTFYELKKAASKTLCIKVGGQYYISPKPLGVAEWACKKKDKSLAWAIVNNAIEHGERLSEDAAKCLQSVWGKTQATNRTLRRLPFCLKKVVENVSS